MGWDEKNRPIGRTFSSCPMGWDSFQNFHPIMGWDRSQNFRPIMGWGSFQNFHPIMGWDRSQNFRPIMGWDTSKNIFVPWNGTDLKISVPSWDGILLKNFRPMGWDDFVKFSSHPMRSPVAKMSIAKII
jgi:hypothetical protein